MFESVSLCLSIKKKVTYYDFVLTNIVNGRVDMNRKRKRKIVTTLVAVELEKQRLCASMMLVIVVCVLGCCLLHNSIRREMSIDPMEQEIYYDLIENNVKEFSCYY